MSKRILLAVLVVLGTVPTATQSPTDEQAIREVLKRFYDGWNAHDPQMMVSAYAEDVDHIDVFGEWHKGKAEILKDITWLHGPEGPARTSQKKYVVEKVRLMTPEIAVAQVSSTSQAGPNLGTYVMQKQKRKVADCELHERDPADSALQERNREAALNQECDDLLDAPNVIRNGYRATQPNSA